MSKCLSPDNCNYSDKGWCPRCEPASSPTPPDAPTPEEIAGLNAYVDGFYNPAKTPPSFSIRALASLLRAYEGMRAQVEDLKEDNRALRERREHEIRTAHEEHKVVEMRVRFDERTLDTLGLVVVENELDRVHGEFRKWFAQRNANPQREGIEQLAKDMNRVLADQERAARASAPDRAPTDA